MPQAGVRQHLRLPRIHQGGSDRLPFSCFRHRGTNASQFRAVSGSPSTGRATPKRTPVAPTLLSCRPALRLFGGVCAGTGKPMPHRVVHLGCVRHRVQRHGCAFTQGTDLPWNAQTQFSWLGATEAFSHEGRNRQGERAIHPWLKPRGLLAHFLQAGTQAPVRRNTAGAGGSVRLTYAACHDGHPRGLSHRRWW